MAGTENSGAHVAITAACHLTEQEQQLHPFSWAFRAYEL